MALVPQDALRGLNPLLRVGTQVGEPLNLHRGRDLGRLPRPPSACSTPVHIPEPARRARDYPHQFSGGMQQRAMIAMGLALEPELLVADEPTTALDVTVQAQVLSLLREIRDTHGTAILFITHDLGIVAVPVRPGLRHVRGADRRGGAGRHHPGSTLAPLHPGPPARDADRRGGGKRALRHPGPDPGARRPGRGCRFADRCPYVFDRCAVEPGLLAAGPDHRARCWLVER